MASRIPRRTFGPSLVITLATLPLGAGCGNTYTNPPRPPPTEPTPDTTPTTEITLRNPPAPDPTHVAPPTEPTSVAPPEPKPEPRIENARWRLSKSGGRCTVTREANCTDASDPKCGKSQPAAYPCPDGYEGQSDYEVRRFFVDGECELHIPEHCPPHAHCNPPRPQTVECPK
jgi:hypothetical protein